MEVARDLGRMSTRGRRSCRRASTAGRSPIRWTGWEGGAAIEESRILACSFSGQTYPPGPERKVISIMLVFVGGARRPNRRRCPTRNSCPGGRARRHARESGRPIYCDMPMAADHAAVSRRPQGVGGRDRGPAAALPTSLPATPITASACPMHSVVASWRPSGCWPAWRPAKEFRQGRRARRRVPHAQGFFRQSRGALRRDRLPESKGPRHSVRALIQTRLARGQERLINPGMLTLNFLTAFEAACPND